MNNSEAPHKFSGLGHGGHPEITSFPVTISIVLFFPFSYRAGKNFRIHGIFCSEGHKFFLFKVQNHRIAHSLKGGLVGTVLGARS